MLRINPKNRDLRTLPSSINAVDLFSSGDPGSPEGIPRPASHQIYSPRTYGKHRPASLLTHSLRTYGKHRPASLTSHAISVHKGSTCFWGVNFVSEFACSRTYFMRAVHSCHGNTQTRPCKRSKRNGKPRTFSFTSNSLGKRTARSATDPTPWSVKGPQHPRPLIYCVPNTQINLSTNQKLTWLSLAINARV